MGYRRLLKTYLTYVEDLTGCSFVDHATGFPRFNNRDLTELRVLKAELSREAAKRQELSAGLPVNPAAPVPTDYGAMLAITLRTLGLKEEDASRELCIPVEVIRRWCYTTPEAAKERGEQAMRQQEFRRALLTLLAANKKENGNGN